eukprot:s878_g15.t1
MQQHAIACNTPGKTLKTLRKNTLVMPVPKLSSQHAAEKSHQVQPKTACSTSGGLEQNLGVVVFSAAVHSVGFQKREASVVRLFGMGQESGECHPQPVFWSQKLQQPVAKLL